MRHVGRPDRRREAAAIVSAVGVMLVCWMLLVPQGAQPDEHSHLVRSAALVRGSDGSGSHVVPDRYRVAEPACYAFDPNQPVTCTAPPEHLDADVTLVTRADDYPPGGHAVFGLAGLLPGLDPVWWARLAATGVSTALLGVALTVARRRDRLLAAAVLLATTPMAWSIMTAVNPSAFATAGAVALSVGLVAFDGRPLTRWLAAAGWIALVLPRRDGLVWACVIVALILVMEDRSLAEAARRLGRAPMVVMTSAAAVTLVWGLGSESTTSRLIVLAPVGLLVAEVVDRVRHRVPDGAGERLAIATAGVLVGVVGWVLLVATRPGGWDSDLLVDVVAQTDDNLVEAIGVLGWLDTPVPAFVVFGWIFAVGALVPLALPDRAWVWPGVLTLLAVVTSWTFELIQGNATGTYWQGRYSLPLLVGVPILLVHRCRGDLAQRLVAPIALGSLLFVNVAAWAAARRFGVGHRGSLLPWRWDTPLHPLPPVLLLVVLAGASLAVAALVVGPSDEHR